MNATFSETLERSNRWALTVVGLAMAAYHMLYTQVFLQSAIGHYNTHLGFALLVAYLEAAHEAKRVGARLLLLGLALLAGAATGYVQLLWPQLQQRAYFNTPTDLVVGVVIVFLVLDATRRTFGWILPALALFVVIYPFFGRSLPEPFRCTALPFDETISNLSIGLQNGIYGIVLPTSANFIFLFAVFGAVLQALGGTRVFLLISRAVAGKLRGGPGLMALVSSALVGSITGSAAANVVITGSFTIPLMKKVGYKPEHAAAIEAAASNGGQIMPPVMGIVAFGMAGLTGIPYLQICLMALIPAILYFYSAGLYVYFRAGQLGIGKMTDSEETSAGEILRNLPAFVTPFVVILTLLVLGYSVMFVGFWAIVTAIAVAYLGGTRPSLTALVRGFVNGAKAGAAIGASAGCVGLIMATFTMSGLGVKLSSGIQTWSGGHLSWALLIIAAVSIVLGMGGASLTGYFIVSIFGVPALQKMGVPFEQAHFFTMFFAVFAFLTPPVALVSMIAAKLADASYTRTAIESTKAAICGFIIPFLFIYSPVLLLSPKDPFHATLSILAAFGCLLGFQIAFVGYYLTACGLPERGLALLWAAAMYLACTTEIYALFAAGAVLAIGQTLSQRRRWLAERPSLALATNVGAEIDPDPATR
jgi:TRAP transporter 4TM/12TM fusion protein